MPYTPVWTNGVSGRVVGGQHWISAADLLELADATNRRRQLVYLGTQSFTTIVAVGLFASANPITGRYGAPPQSLREAISGTLIEPAAGGLGGDPATPAAMHWLWPVAGDNENKVIVATTPGAGEINLFEQLSEEGGWTDDLAGLTPIRAIHVNELRQAVEWLSRGRWTLPIYTYAGLLSLLPDTSWIGNAVGNNGSAELRSAGPAILRSGALGLTGVTARAGTGLTITADTTCTIEVYQCLRPLNFAGDPATWNEYLPAANGAWDVAGGCGDPDDSTYLGQIVLTAGVAGTLSSAALLAAVQAMLEGEAEQNFIFRRSDTGFETVTFAAELVVEFDLDSPPN